MYVQHLIIAVLDFMNGSTPLSARAHQGQVLAAGFGTLLLGLVGISLFASAAVPRIGWISLSSLVFIGIYLIAIRTVFLYAISMTALAIIGLTYQTTQKRHVFAWDSIGIVVVYVLATSILYVTGSQSNRRKKMKVKDIMTEPVITIAENTPLQEVARIMIDHRIEIQRGQSRLGTASEVRD